MTSPTQPRQTPHLLVGLSVLSLALGFSWSSPAQASELDPTLEGVFSQANQLAVDGQYPEALGQYRKLLDAGVESADLYYNLGYCAYRAGQKGLAVLFFEKALKLDPGDEDARNNLGLVVRELTDKLAPAEGGPQAVPPWQALLQRIPLDGLGWLCSGFGWAFVLVALFRRFGALGNLRKLLFWLNVPIAFLTLVLIGLFVARLWVEENLHEAVVIQPVSRILEGPKGSAKVLLEVHEGLKVRLLGSQQGFERVRLQNGVEGYVSESELGRI